MPTLNVQVGASAGDATQQVATVSITEAVGYVGYASWVGWRFTGVNIPRNAPIVSAVLTVEIGDAAADWPDLIFYGQDADDAAAFAATSINISARTRTTAEVQWRPASELGASAGDRVTSPDLSALVQEIVNRPGWSTGNALVIVARGMNSERILGLRMYDNAAGDAAELDVAFLADETLALVTGHVEATGYAVGMGTAPNTVMALVTGHVEATGYAIPKMNRYTPDLYSAAVLSEASLVGYWRQGDSSAVMADSSPTGNDGSYVNSPTQSRPTLLAGAGQGGLSVDYDEASSQYGDIPDHASYAATRLTVEALISPTATGIGASRTILNRRTAANDGGFSLEFENGGSGGLTLWVNIGGTWYGATTAAALTAGAVYHVTGRFDGSTVKAQAVNVETLEKTEGANAQGGDMATPATPLVRVAQNISSGAHYFDGRIQEVALYDKALSDARVAAHVMAAHAHLMISLALVTGHVEVTGYALGMSVLTPPADRGRLRVDLYTQAGAKLASPPLTMLTADYGEAVDEVGDFALSVSAADEAAAAVAIGQRLRIYREGEGEVFRGIVREREWQDGPDGAPVLVIRGPSVADDLVGTNLLLGRNYEDRSPQFIASELVALVSGWALGTVLTPRNPGTSLSAEGASVFAALRQLARRAQAHVRVNPVAQTIDLVATEDVADFVANGTFEDSALGWGPAGDPSVTFSRSTAEASEGVASCRVVTSADGTYRGITQLREHRIALAAGKSATLSFDLKAPDAGHVYSYGFSWFDSDDVFLSDSLEEEAAGSTAWVAKAMTTTAPANADHGRVVIYRKDNAAVTFYVDAVEVTVPSQVVSSGIRLAQLPAFDPAHAEDYPDIVPIRSVTVTEAGHEVWNSVLPHGAGEGEAALTLEHSDRVAPYEILVGVAPDDRSLFYIEDTASIATHGRRQHVLPDKHAVPLSESADGRLAASNALYDAAVTALLESKDPRFSYRVSPSAMAHLSSGARRFDVGETLHVVYRGRAEKEDGTGHQYLDVGAHLFLSRFRRRCGADSDEWTFDVTTKMGERLDGPGRLARYMEDVWAMLVEPRLTSSAPANTGQPVDEVTAYEVQVDLRRAFWATRALCTFQVNQGGGGNWGGTITINGTDRTAALGGTFATGVDHTVNVKPYLAAFTLNRIVFAKGSAFTIETATEVRTAFGGAAT